jgi:hypothetical protein
MTGKNPSGWVYLLHLIWCAHTGILLHLLRPRRAKRGGRESFYEKLLLYGTADGTADGTT